MSYSTMAQSVNDGALRQRVIACCAREERFPAEQAAEAVIWKIAGDADIEAAYAAALTADNQNPGGDETVVSDAMILSIVQANPWTPPTTPSP